jgi:hypothetical protein
MSNSTPKLIIAGLFFIFFVLALISFICKCHPDFDGFITQVHLRRVKGRSVKC